MWEKEEAVEEEEEEVERQTIIHTRAKATHTHAHTAEQQTVNTNIRGWSWGWGWRRSCKPPADKAAVDLVVVVVVAVVVIEVVAVVVVVVAAVVIVVVGWQCLHNMYLVKWKFMPRLSLPICSCVTTGPGDKWNKMSFDSSSQQASGVGGEGEGEVADFCTPLRLSSFCGPVNSFSKLTKNACAHFA